MTKLPEHIAAELSRLITEDMPADEIAFMMRLSRKVVDEAIAKEKPRVSEAAPKR